MGDRLVDSDSNTSHADIALAPSTSDDFVQKFADDSKWKVLRGVPVFDEHEEEMEVPVVGPDGKKTTQKSVERFSRQELQEIADNCNRLVATGNPPGLTIGHTKDDAAETDQPETIGYGCNYRVAAFGPEQKLGILHDEKYYPQKYELAKTMPYRSVERWRAGKYFKPIALLRREPRRNLGVVAAYQASNGDTAVRYSMRYAMPEEIIDKEKEEIPAKPAAAPEAPAAPPAPDASAAPPEAELEPSEKDKALFQKLYSAHPHYQMHCKNYEALGAADNPDGAGHAERKADPQWEQKKGYASGPGGGMSASPSATNTAIPGMENPRMSASTLDVARYQADLRERDSRIAALERENRIERYSSVFNQLADQGYELDVAKEVTRYQDAGSQSVEERVGEIRKYHQRRAVGMGPIRLAGTPDPNAPDPDRIQSKKEMDAVLQYQAEHPAATNREALAKVRAAGVVRGVA